MTDPTSLWDADAIAAAWRRERPDLPVESIGVITRIWQASKLLTDQRRRTMNRLGMDVATRDLLSTLRRSGEPYALTPGELARACAVTPGAISQRVLRAERVGYVTRTRSDTDGRSHLVRLTRAGHEAVDETVGELLRYEQTLVSSLDADQQRQLGDLLRILVTDLRTRAGEDLPPDLA